MFNRKILLVLSLVFILSGCNMVNGAADYKMSDNTIASDGREECLVYIDESTPANLCVVTKEIGDKINIYVRNKKPGHATITLDMTLDNLKANKKLPYVGVLKPNTLNKVLVLSKKDKDKPVDYKYTLSWQDGVKNAKHDNTYVYTLPYEVGTTHQVVLGYNGFPTHVEQGKYAIDWEMEVGTSVLAAREGIVTAILDNFTEGGPDLIYKDKANFVAVQHSDGTVGLYVHNAYHSAKVKVGDKVRAGQELASAGNVGYSTDNHLHFEVRRPISGSESVTVPTKFKIDYKKSAKLVEGFFYTAPGDTLLSKASDLYGNDSLAALPERLSKLVNSTSNREKAAQILVNYLKANQDNIKKQWKDLSDRAVAGDREAQRQLQGVLDNCLSLQMNKDLAKIFDPDLPVLAAAEEATSIWDQLWGL